MRLPNYFKFFLLPVVILLLPFSSFSQTTEQKSSIIGNFDSITYNFGSIFAYGWAASTKSGTPVKKVEVYIEDSLTGNAKLGTKRPDVAKVMKKEKWINAGWELGLNKKLKKGAYSCYAIVYGDKDEKTVFRFNKKLVVE